MKEHYVSFEQSQALKMLGFTEKVNHGYSRKLRIEPDLSYGKVKEVHSKDPKNFNDNRKGIDKGVEFCSAPRIDEAQAWLRETKGIIISIGPCFYMGRKHLRGYDYHLYNKDDGIKSYIAAPTVYDTYELALSAGISKALELLGKEVNNGM